MTHVTRRSLPNQRTRLTAAIEPLERRLLLTSVVVNTTADSTDASGSTVVSLRDAINIANGSTTATTITFSPTVFATAKTITLDGTALEISGTQPVTITGPVSGVTVDGNQSSGEFVIDAAVTATISGLTIADGTSETGGGGIENDGTLTLTTVNVTGNNRQAGTGGGIVNAGTLVLNNSTVANNSSHFYDGGGIENETGAKMTLTDVTVSGNSADNSGGIDNRGTATLTGVTVSDNVAVGFDFHADTPGIDGGIGNYGTMTLTDSTVSGNSSGQSGGGIGNHGALTLADSTLSDNAAGGGAIYPPQSYAAAGMGSGLCVYPSSSSTVISNTIIAQNQVIAGKGSGGSAIAGTGPDVSGAVQSSGYNLIGQTDGSTGWNSTDLTGTAAHPLNPDLGSLANNGGPTLTMLPLADSPALGAGSVALVPAGTTTDQRGLARVVNGKVDIGAVEAQNAASSAVITGTVFNDANGDGAQDNGEAGLAAVQVYLDLGNVGQFVTGDPTTMTSATGGYTLPGLAAGNYIVRQVSPSGYAQTTPTGGLGRHVTVSTGQTLGGQNFGDKSTAAPGATVSGTVFNDANGDGAQDNGEAGLAAVQVYLDLGNVGHFVTGDPTTMTSANGGYTLPGLAPGNYIVRQLSPSGYAQTTPIGGLGRHVTVSTGQTLGGQNFGDKSTAAPGAAITGTVFNDANGDGTQDNGEAGLAGVQVYLDLGNVGHFVTGDPTTMTSATGGYTLSGLAAGNDIVREVPPSGFVQTAPSGGLGRHVTVSTGQTLAGQNFGDKATAAPAAAITGTVFNDANGDGIQDDGETGLAGVQVYLDLGNVGYFVTGDPTTMTGATGTYTLSGLTAGNYIVRQVRPSDDVQTTPVNGLGRHVTVAAGQTLSGQIFGDRA
jgi:CSLREA domain-containing protein